VGHSWRVRHLLRAPERQRGHFRSGRLAARDPENPTLYNIVGYNSIGGGGLSGTTSIGGGIYPDQIRWPYVQQWHFDLQHDIMKDTVGTLAYVGAKGTHLVWQRNINQLHPLSPSANPFRPGQPLTDAECNTVTGAWTQGVSPRGERTRH
jgi:hypothetical protein